MRIFQIAISYASALVFASVAASAFTRWSRARERRSGHLALATGLFATSQFISANTSAFFNNLQGQVAPRWITVTSGVIGAIALYAFVLFLFDFVKTPAIARAVILLGTVEFIIFTIVEHSSTRIVGDRFIFEAHPIPFRTYLWVIVGWYLLLTGIMWLSFLVYGLRNSGLARARMLCIAGGFFLIFIVIGLIPLLLLENSTSFLRTFGTFLGVLILFSAPLMFIGFTPPAWFRARYPEQKTSRIKRSAVA